MGLNYLIFTRMQQTAMTRKGALLYASTLFAYVPLNEQKYIFAARQYTFVCVYVCVCVCVCCLSCNKGIVNYILYSVEQANTPLFGTRSKDLSKQEGCGKQ